MTSRVWPFHRTFDNTAIMGVLGSLLLCLVPRTSLSDQTPTMTLDPITEQSQHRIVSGAYQIETDHVWRITAPGTSVRYLESSETGTWFEPTVETGALVESVGDLSRDSSQGIRLEFEFSPTWRRWLESSGSDQKSSASPGKGMATAFPFAPTTDGVDPKNHISQDDPDKQLRLLVKQYGTMKHVLRLPPNLTRVRDPVAAIAMLKQWIAMDQVFVAAGLKPRPQVGETDAFHIIALFQDAAVGKPVPMKDDLLGHEELERVWKAFSVRVRTHWAPALFGRPDLGWLVARTVSLGASATRDSTRTSAGLESEGRGDDSLPSIIDVDETVDGVIWSGELNREQTLASWLRLAVPDATKRGVLICEELQQQTKTFHVDWVHHKDDLGFLRVSLAKAKDRGRFEFSIGTERGSRIVHVIDAPLGASKLPY